MMNIHNTRSGTPQVVRRTSIAMVILAGGWTLLPVSPSATSAAPRVLHTSKTVQTRSLPPTACDTDEDCDDGNACTEDACVDHLCVHTPIADCVPCDPTPICPPLEVVFIVDTSGSMADEAAALCEHMAEVVADLGALGVMVEPHYLGITKTPGGAFDCLDIDVVSMLGGEVPAEPPSSCEFPGPASDYEAWGPATSIVAERFPWAPEAMRVIVPISDEGPCNGSYPDGCNDPGDDRESIDNAVAVANANGVIVSPITGTSSDGCVLALATALADGTDGVTYQTEDPNADLAAAIYQMLLDLCAPAPCDDGDPCTLNDVCIEGVCVGDPPEVVLIPCSDHGDCPGGWFCNLQPGDPLDGYCDCGPTPLCVEFDQVCYEEDELVEATITIGAGSAIVLGGQFLLEYDPSCVEFLDIGPCEGSVFTVVLDWWVDPDAGRIWYVAIDGPEAPSGTQGPHDIACIQFRKLDKCEPCNICLLSDNPYNTMVVGGGGEPVSVDNCGCSEEILFNPTVELTCPPSISQNADPGRPTALVTWDPVTAVDSCAGPVEVECTATHSGGVPIEHLITGGGILPAGVSAFECTTTDAPCGGPSSCEWVVSVSEANTVEIDLKLGYVDPGFPIVPGPLERCIEFEFFSDCVGQPEIVREVITFGWPYNLPGQADGVTFKVPAEKYACVTARDPLHTLRSTAEMTIEGDIWMARFVGDPAQGGNWLRGGNLDGNLLIDILDLGTVRSQFGMHLNPNTTCYTASPHADINGDGIVDSADEAFVIVNYLQTDKETCCPEAVASDRAVPITEISIPELRQMGLGHLSVADTNNDGVLNVEDFAHPMETPVKRSGRGRR